MSEENPWITESSRIVYENAWISVREDQVIRPDGKPGIYGVVEGLTACGVLALDADNNVYLVGQYRYPTKQYSWEIIAGGCAKDEAPIDAAKRELREEAGLTAKNWVQIPGEFHLSNCISSEIAYLFIARDLSEVESEPEGTEVLKVKKMPFKEVLDLVNQGQVQDALTIMAVLRASFTI